MKNILKFIGIIALAGIIYSCQDKDANSFLDASGEELTFSSDGGTQYATIFASGNFTVTSSEAWCKIEKIEGEKNDNLKITVERNEGTERTATIEATAEGLDKITITVKQALFIPTITVKEGNVNIGDTLNFTLEITSNILFTIETPTWIEGNSSNVPAIGTKTYSFTASPIGDVGVRAGKILLKANYQGVDTIVGVPVLQGDPTVILVGKDAATTVPAEKCTEGWQLTNAVDWLLFDGYVVLGGADGLSQLSASYRIYATDEGNYNFNLKGATWGTTATMSIYVDNKMTKLISVPQNANDDPSSATGFWVKLGDVALTSGMHTVKFLYNLGSGGGVFDFDKYTMTYNGNITTPDPEPDPVVSKSAPVTIESDACTEGYAAVMPLDWLFNKETYIIIGENEPASYKVNVTDAGNYDFKLNAATWSSTASVGLYIDNNTTATATVPISKIDNTIDYLFVSLDNVALPSGKHVIKFKLLNPEGQTLNFNKFTITSHP